MSTQADAFGQRLQREAGVAFGVAVGVAGEGAEFLGAPAQGAGRVRVLPRVVAAVVVEGEEAGVCEVVGVVGAGGQSSCLPLQVLQPLRFAPFRDRTLRCVGHWRFPCRQVSRRGWRFLLVSRRIDRDSRAIGGVLHDPPDPRRAEEEAVEPVQHAAVSGQNAPEVFDADGALERGFE